jgi:hypothetical protein
VWLNLDPRQGLDPSAGGPVSGERSPLKGVLRGEVARGDDPEGGGSGPRLSGLAPGGKKAYSCKLWVAIGVGLLRFLGRRALTRSGRRGRVGADPLPGWCRGRT